MQRSYNISLHNHLHNILLHWMNKEAWTKMFIGQIELAIKTQPKTKQASRTVRAWGSVKTSVWTLQ